MIDCEGKRYTVKTAYHLLQNRETLKGTSPHFRGKHIDEKRYNQIVRKALYQGLTSFRNKGPAVITFLDGNQRPFGVLVNLEDANEVFVITVFRGPKGMGLERCFIKVGNRINLVDYTMEPLSEAEIQKNKVLKAERQTTVTRSEENEFLRAMKH